MKTKAFDCVEMKRQIQAKQIKEMESMSPEEWRARSMQKILSNPRLRRIWEQGKRGHATAGASMASEDHA